MRCKDTMSEAATFPPRNYTDRELENPTPDMERAMLDHLTPEELERLRIAQRNIALVTIVQRNFLP